MENKDPRLSSERIGGRGDENAIGRETSGFAERSSGPTSAPPPQVAPRTRKAAPEYSESSMPRRDDDVPETRTRQIRADIEHTRGEMSETVDAIQDRLRPSTLAANAAESVKDAASETAHDIVESDPVQYIRANPFPTAMVGIGVAGLVWLAMSGRQGRSHDRRPLGTTSPDRGASAAYGRAYAHGSGMSDRSAARAGAMTDSMRRRAEQTAHRAQNHVRRTWDESPFLIGAAAALLGAIIGSAVPETERENQLMGETRDSMVESVENSVRGKVSQVEDAAKNAVGQVQDAATKAVGLGSGGSSTAEPRK